MAKKKSKAKAASGTCVYVVEVHSSYSWAYQKDKEWNRLKAVRVGDTREEAEDNLDAYFVKMANKSGGLRSGGYNSKEYRISCYARKSSGKAIDPGKRAKKPAKSAG